MGNQRTVARQLTPEVRRSAVAAAPVRAAAAPHATSTVQLLQRRLGNQGSAALIAKSSLRVSSPQDASEREATSKASEVMRRSTPVAPVSAVGTADLQRCDCGHGGEHAVQLKEAGPAPASRDVSGEIHSSMSGGSPLPVGVRGFMEPRFGANFGNVRVHTGERAAELSQNLNAHAFTVGNHVFFGKNQFQPETGPGRELIAHELTHTIQQGAVAQRSAVGEMVVQRDGEDQPDNRSWWQKLTDFGESAAWSMVRAVAPEGETIIRGGVGTWISTKITTAVEKAFNTLMAPVRAIEGAGAALTGLVSPMVTALQTAAGQIARNDCSPIRDAAQKIEQVAVRIITPIVEKLQPVVAKVKGVLNDIWDKIGAPIWEWIQQYAKEQWEAIKWLAGLVRDYYVWIWEKTAWIRDIAARAWTWVKNKLGIGEGEEGQNGFLQWAQAKLEAAWNVIKAKIEPFRTQITAVVTAVGAVLLALSPAGPIAAVGAAVVGAVQGLRWIAAHWGKGDALVQARAYVERTMIPALQGAIARLRAALGQVASAIMGALGSLASAMMRVASWVGGSIISFAVGLVQWIADQVNALAAWADSKLDGLSHWLNGAVDKLANFLRQVLRLLKKVGDVIIDIYGLPIMLAERVWDMMPACVRDPIVDFIGPIILRQIELFSELGKDNDAWQKTKQDIGKLIKLVFKDHDLVGAVKAAFQLVLRVFNVPMELLTSIYQKAMAAWDTVSKKPIEFIKNTVKAIGQGFKLLKDNFWGHLQYGLEGWLFGELAEKGINKPSSWTDPKALFLFALDVLGLSVNHIFELMKKRFSPPERVDAIKRRMGQVASVLAWVDRSIDLTKSPAENAKGMWDQAKAFGGEVLTGIAEWIAGKVAEELAILATAAAASGGLSEVLDVLRRVYKVLVSVKRYLAGILRMVSSVLDQVLLLAGGKWEKVGEEFEKIMHRGMPIVIGFLAEQVGLGGIGAEIRKLVDKLRERVDTAILWLIDKLRAGFEWLIRTAQAGLAAVVDWWRERRNFRGADGARHSVFVEGGEHSAQMIIQSAPKEVSVYLEDIIDDSNTKAGVRRKAQTALNHFNRTLVPVLRGRASETLKDQFPSNLTTLSDQLMSIVGVSDRELPTASEVEWDYRGPRSASVKLLSTKTSTGGTEPRENPTGWEALQKAGLTRLRGDWKRMHMITAGVGGKGVAGNLIPAPAAVNSGSTVRGFELDVEALVKRENRSTRKSNVVWITVTAGGFRPAYDDPIRGIQHDGRSFPSTVTLTAGLHYPTEEGEWAMDATAVLSASDNIPAPNFEGGPVDLNTVGRVYIERLCGVSEGFARKVTERQGKWKSYQGFVRGMITAEPRPVSAEFEASLLKVQVAVEANVVNFGE